MKKQIVFLLAVATLLSGCCTKKGCPDWELPVLTIHFTDAGNDDMVTLYTLKDNVATDSLKQKAAIDLELRPFTDNNVETAAGKSYIISHNGKMETLSDFTAKFEQEEMVCNKCFPFGNEKQTIWKNSGFGYKHNSQNKSDRTLELNF